MLSLASKCRSYLLQSKLKPPSNPSAKQCPGSAAPGTTSNQEKSVKTTGHWPKAYCISHSCVISQSLGRAHLLPPYSLPSILQISLLLIQTLLSSNLQISCYPWFSPMNTISAQASEALVTSSFRGRRIDGVACVVSQSSFQTTAPPAAEK